jgi:ribosomal protein S14
LKIELDELKNDMESYVHLVDHFHISRADFREIKAKRHIPGNNIF